MSGHSFFASNPGTVPVNKELLTGTGPVNNLFQKELPQKIQKSSKPLSQRKEHAAVLKIKSAHWMENV